MIATAPDTGPANSPPVLAYAAPVKLASRKTYVAGSFLMSTVFVITFWIVEGVTSNVLLFHIQIEGPADRGTQESSKLEDREFENLMIEFAWSLPAAALVFATSMFRKPRGGWRIPWKALVTAALGAFAYSWVRWAFDIISIQIPDPANFALAMLLALATGVITSVARSNAPI